MERELDTFTNLGDLDDDLELTPGQAALIQETVTNARRSSAYSVARKTAYEPVSMRPRRKGPWHILNNSGCFQRKRHQSETEAGRLDDRSSYVFEHLDQQH